jgi:hypothetical protein
MVEKNLNPNLTDSENLNFLTFHLNISFVARFPKFNSKELHLTMSVRILHMNFKIGRIFSALYVRCSQWTWSVCAHVALDVGLHIHICNKDVSNAISSSSDFYDPLLPLYIMSSILWHGFHKPSPPRT